MYIPGLLPKGKNTTKSLGNLKKPANSAITVTSHAHYYYNSIEE